jgi:hypothetical protein
MTCEALLAPTPKNDPPTSNGALFLENPNPDTTRIRRTMLDNQRVTAPLRTRSGEPLLLQPQPAYRCPHSTPLPELIASMVEPPARGPPLPNRAL